MAVFLVVSAKLSLLGLILLDSRRLLVPGSNQSDGPHGKKRSVCPDVVGNSVWQKVGEHFLTSVHKNCYVSPADLFLFHGM